jgi:hypothetical protein
MKGIIVDDDKNLSYDKNSPIRKATNAVLIPALNVLPVGTRKLLRKTHVSGAEIIEHATTHKAMEVLYDIKPRPEANWLQNFFLSIWLGTNNSKAVRNRLKLVKREIKNKIKDLALQNKEIRILNIASGAASAVTESINEISSVEGLNISATFIDMNHEAISFSQELAGSHRYRSSFEWIHDSSDNYLENSGKGKKFDIVEMVGLLEYLSDEEAIKQFRKIREILDIDGVLITANIVNNIERRFISDVVGWKMKYRTAGEFSSLLIDAGFELRKMKIYYEPQKIHCVIVAHL